MKKRINTLVLLTVITYPLMAEWTLVDSFEEGAANMKYTYVVDSGDRDTPEHNYVTDPEDQDNTAFWIDPVAYGVEWMIIYANWVLEEPIREGSIGTIYLRYYATGSNPVAPVVGLTDVPVEIGEDNIPTQPTGWASHEAATSFSSDLFFAPRDASAYVATTYNFTPGEWYEIWGVVNNKVGATDDETTWYIKGPGDSEPVHIMIPNANGDDFDTTLFRNGTTSDLIGFSYAILAGNPAAPKSGIPAYVDDFYIDVSGENLTSPTGGTPETFAGYPVANIDVTKWIDTGNYLGWLEISSAPYIWITNIQGWIYMEESEIQNGGWAYMFK